MLTAKLAKKYVNFAGHQFQRVEVWANLGCLSVFDIRIRTGRDGLVMMNSRQCKERAIYLHQQAAAGLRHSSMVS